MYKKKRKMDKYLESRGISYKKRVNFIFNSEEIVSIVEHDVKPTCFSMLILNTRTNIMSSNDIYSGLMYYPYSKFIRLSRIVPEEYIKQEYEEVGRLDLYESTKHV